MDMRKSSSKTSRDSRGHSDRNRDRDFVPSRKRYQLDPEDIIDINDVEVLKHFVTEYGKIIPARISGVTSAQQRQIKCGVRRARNMGLLA